MIWKWLRQLFCSHVFVNEKGRVMDRGLSSEKAMLAMTDAVCVKCGKISMTKDLFQEGFRKIYALRSGGERGGLSVTGRDDG